MIWDSIPQNSTWEPLGLGLGLSCCVARIPEPASPKPSTHGAGARIPVMSFNVGALYIIRAGFWGIIDHNYNKEPPK